MFPLSLLISLVYQIFTENKSIYYLFHFVSVLLIKFLFTELCQYKIRIPVLSHAHQAKIIIRSSKNQKKKEQPSSEESKN